jgi:hypothetical protein
VCAVQCTYSPESRRRRIEMILRVKSEKAVVKPRI